MTATMADFTLTGTTEVTLTLDPSEFEGMTVPEITAELFEILSSIAPEVNFIEVEDAVVDVAGELHGAGLL